MRMPLSPARTGQIRNGSFGVSAGDKPTFVQSTATLDSCETVGADVCMAQVEQSCQPRARWRTAGKSCQRTPAVLA